MRATNKGIAATCDAYMRGSSIYPHMNAKCIAHLLSIIQNSARQAIPSYVPDDCRRLIHNMDGCNMYALNCRVRAPTKQSLLLL